MLHPTAAEMLVSGRVSDPTHKKILELIVEGKTYNEVSPLVRRAPDTIKNWIWNARTRFLAHPTGPIDGRSTFSTKSLSPQECLNSGKIIFSKHIAVLNMLVSGKSYPETALAFGYSPAGLRGVMRDIRQRASGKLGRDRAYRLRSKANQLGWRHSSRDIAEIDLYESNDVMEWFKLNVQNLYEILFQGNTVWDKSLVFDTVHQLLVDFLDEPLLLTLDKYQLETVLLMIYRRYSKKEIQVYIRGKHRISVCKRPDEDPEVPCDDFDWVEVQDQNYKLIESDIRTDITKDLNTYSGITIIDLPSNSLLLKSEFDRIRIEADKRQKDLCQGKYAPLKHTKSEIDKMKRIHAEAIRLRKTRGYKRS